MKTTYILHGGSAQHVNTKNDMFFKEILDRTGLDNIKILLVHFAGLSERAKQNKERDSAQFERNKDNKKTTIQIATKKEFIKQLSWADVVYFGGGTTVKLLKEIKGYKNLKKYLEGKVVAGESAGANFLATLCYSKSGGGMIKGLGILPVFVYPHFEKDSTLPDLEIPNSLERLLLANYEYKIFEI